MLLRIHVRGNGLYNPPLVFVGLSTALQPFTKFFAVMPAWAHSPEVCPLGYLGDWFFLASLEREAKQPVQSLSSNCHIRGIVITKEELGIVSSQTAKYFGMTIDTVADMVFPSLTRVVNFMSLVKSFSYHGSALTGGPRSPVFARATGPSPSSSVAVSAVASRDELVPRDSPLSLKVHSSWWPVSDHPLTGVSIRCICSRSPPVFRRVLFGGGGGGGGLSPPWSPRLQEVQRPLRGSTSTYSKCRLCLDAVCILCNHYWPYRV